MRSLAVLLLSVVSVCRMFQPAYTNMFMTHGGGGIRPTWGDGEDQVLHAVHFHRYEHPNPAEFWEKEAVRDSSVSDLLEAELWPVGTSQALLDGVSAVQRGEEAEGGWTGWISWCTSANIV